MYRYNYKGWKRSQILKLFEKNKFSNSLKLDKYKEVCVKKKYLDSSFQ